MKIVAPPSARHQALQVRVNEMLHNYEIVVENPLGVCSGVLAVKADGQTITGNQKNLIPLVDDGAQHRILVVLG